MTPTTELPLMRRLMLALGARRDVRVHRQNCGKVPVRDARGRILRTFDAGPAAGAADISGIVRPEGWRLEIETKAGGGKRTPAQRAWARMIAEAGGVYVLVDFDAALSDVANLARALETVDEAIARRRARP